MKMFYMTYTLDSTTSGYNKTTAVAETGQGGLDTYLIVYISTLGAIIFMTICRGLVGAAVSLRFHFFRKVVIHVTIDL